MEVTRIRALRGPNLWTRHTAIEAMVRCSAPDNTPVSGVDDPRSSYPATPAVGVDAAISHAR